MKDYRIKITIRNERLLSAIEKKGFKSVSSFCRSYGLRKYSILDVINGSKPPINKNKELFPGVKELLDLLELSVEQAFTPRQLGGFRKHSFEVKVEEKQLKKLVDPVKNHEMLMMEKDTSLTLNTMLSELTPREEKVVRMVHGIGMKSDHTFDEVGLQFSVTHERARQIYRKALRKLSRVPNLQKLQEAGAGDVYNVDMSGKNTFGAREMRKMEAKMFEERAARNT